MERIVLGRSVLKEPLLKKEILKFAENNAEAVKTGTVLRVEELAWEILKNNPKIFKQKDFLKPLEFSSRVDALEQLSSHPLFQKGAPRLKRYFRNRNVVQKYARLITRVDEQLSDYSEIEVLIEYFKTQKQNPETAFILTLVSSLWQAGELSPWSKSAWLRSIVQLSNENLAKLSFPFSEINLIGFSEKTALETLFFEKLKNGGILVREESFLKQNSKTTVLYHHTPFDQIHWLMDQVKAEVLLGREVGISVSNEDSEQVIELVRNLAREGFFPNVSSKLKKVFWKTNNEAVFWSTLLDAFSKPGGFEINDIKNFFPESPCLKEILDKAYHYRIDRGGKALKYLHSKLTGDAQKILDFLISFYEILAVSQKPEQVLNSFLGFHNKYFDFLKIELNILEPQDSLLICFLSSLYTDRDFLREKKLKSRFLSQAFKEWVPLIEKNQKVFSSVWLFDTEEVFPVGLDLLFVLSFNTLEQKKNETKIDEFPIDLAWAQVHSEFKSKEQLNYEMHSRVVFSGCQYNYSGNLLPMVSDPRLLTWFKNAEIDLAQFKKTTHTHTATGWNRVVLDQSHPNLKIVSDYKMPQSMSVSAFEDYLKCPYLFYSRHVTKAKPLEELDVEVSPLSMGDLLHSVLAAFLADNNGSELNQEKLYEILDRKFLENSKKGLLASKQLEEQFYRDAKARLEKWFDFETENRKKHPDLKLLVVEHAFELEIEPDFKLVGRIDRIDQSLDGLVIIDYKTGEGPFRGKELLFGKGVQLFAYGAYAWKKWAKEPGSLHYLALTRKPNSTAGVFLKKFQKKIHSAHFRNGGLVDCDFETVYISVEDAWKRAIENLRAGNFTPNPYDASKLCRTCAYKTICGFKQQEQKEEEFA